ncbi:MAG: efflux RND transporter permease subunit [Candidatus Omnitrophica bacterium]|nr:efflux RND transporter permease subunit [Candidatus Omnitrophota bacterium]
MNIPEFSVKRKITTLMLVLIFSAIGILSFFNLGLDMLPDLEFPVVAVVTSYEGVASEEIESGITKLIEESVGLVKHIKKVTSFSMEGISAVMIEFEWGTNLDFAAQDVRDRLSIIEEYLPKDADRPIVVKYNPSDMPVLIYAVTGFGNDTLKLRTYLNDEIKPRLEGEEGVANVFLSGGRTREINVLIDGERLNGYNLSLNQISQAMRYENLNISGGRIKEGYREYLLRTPGEYKSVEEIKNTVVGVYNGAPVYLRDIAEVKDTFKEVRSFARVDGRDCVVLGIMKQSGANIVKVSDRVGRKIESLKNIMPADMKFAELMNFGNVAKRMVKMTAIDVMVGGVITVALLLFLLRSFIPTLVVALSIPFSIFVAFIGIYAAGYTLNITTMTGLGLGIGMLVSNAIIVMENIFRYMEQGENVEISSSKGTNEVMAAIFASTLTTVIVFLPAVFVTGITARLIRPIAITVTVSLLASFIAAITLVPMVSSVLFRGKGEKLKMAEEKEFGKIKKIYSNSLSYALNHKTLFVIPPIVLFLLSMWSLRFVGKEFFPSMDTPMQLISLRMPVGTPLEDTEYIMSTIEKACKEPELIHIATTGGLSEGGKTDVAFGGGSSEVYEAQAFARFKWKEERKRSMAEIKETIRKKLPSLKEVHWEFSDMSRMMTSTGGETQDMVIKIFGSDMDQLYEIAKEIKRRVEGVEGLKDVDISLKTGKPEIKISIDREKASRLGLSTASIGQTITTAFLGEVSTRYKMGGEEYDVRIRFEERCRKTVKDIENLYIPTMTGYKVPLKEVAKTEIGEGPVKIERENKKRKVSVTANISGRDLGSVVKDVEQRISDVKLPFGYYIEFGGQYEKMKEAFGGLLIALIFAVFLVYMVMASTFESLLHPFMVMFTVLLGMIGVIVGLLLFRSTLNIGSFLGIILMAGVVVNNGIVLVDYVNLLRRQKNKDVRTALIEGCVTKLRAITLTTVFGMLPMAISRSQGSEFRAPMAVSVIGGVLISALFTLYLIPVIYEAVDGYIQKRKVER